MHHRVGGVQFIRNVQIIFSENFGTEGRGGARTRAHATPAAACPWC